MASIAEQLTQLTQDRDDLVSNLTTKGISGLTGDETFTELVPEVLNIQSGADLSEYFTSTITAGDSSTSGVNKMVKKLPSNITISGTSLAYAFAGANNLTTIPNLDTSSVTNMSNMFYYNYAVTTIPLFNTSNVTNMSNMFSNATNLQSIPQLDTSKVTNMAAMFSYCSRLTTVPQLDTSKVTNMNSMFSSCGALTNESLNNILAMCINATSYNGTKTLYQLGFRSNQHSVSKIQALSNYQDFIDAGWTIGY